MIQQITSAKNARVRHFSRLYRRKYREKTNLYIVEGIHLIEEILKNDVLPEDVFVRDDFMSGQEGFELVKRLDGLGCRISIMPHALFDRTADTETPQGVAAVVPKPDSSLEGFFDVCGQHEGCCGCGAAEFMPQPQDAGMKADFAHGVTDDRNKNKAQADSPTGTLQPQDAGMRANLAQGAFLPNILVLDRLQDPGNLGTILRTADAAGFRKIIVMKGTADIFGPKTVRAAAGSLLRVRFTFLDEPREALNLLRQNGYQIFCTSPGAGSAYFDADLAQGAALVIGNEANGADGVFLKEADMRLNIPMEGSIESLNAAVAASVVMYESVRQRTAVSRK